MELFILTNKNNKTSSRYKTERDLLVLCLLTLFCCSFEKQPIPDSRVVFGFQAVFKTLVRYLSFRIPNEQHEVENTV